MSKPSQYVGNSRWPFGAADVQSLDAAATIAAEVWNTKTILDIAQLSAGATLNLDVDAEVKPGDELVVMWSTAGTQTLTFGTGFTAPSINGVAGKNFMQKFEYEGAQFVPVAEAVTLDGTLQ
jgi:hypothetical protein